MKKLRKNGGFTLIEMLIVVAIIAILIAISIPLINGALERARDSTDQANERSCKAEATMVFMGVAEDGSYALSAPTSGYVAGQALTAFYNAADGQLVSSIANAKNGDTAYGQCSGCESDYAKSSNTAVSVSGATITTVKNPGTTTHQGCVIKVCVNNLGEVEMAWVS